MRVKRLIFLALPLLAALAASPLHGDVYRWVDDEGNEHFGNKPPPDSDSSLISTFTHEQQSDSSQVLQEADQAFERGDFDRVHQLLAPLAEAGHPRAQNGMGVLFDRGMGVPKDIGTAATWYQRSAEQGYAKAQFNLGVMYGRGEGVPLDLELSAKWYRLAAEQDHAYAQHNLAQMYLSGVGVERDLSAAFKWESSAARLGDFNAQYTLGLMYFYGQGTGANSHLAYEWIAKGMSGGYPIKINLPPGLYIGHHAADASKGDILEFILPNEDIDNWSQLVTVQRMSNAWGQATPEATLEDLKAHRENLCPGVTTWNTIEYDANSITYEWQSYACADWPPQHEVAKIMYRPDARAVLHFAIKGYQMPDEIRSKWIERFASAR